MTKELLNVHLRKRQVYVHKIHISDLGSPEVLTVKLVSIFTIGKESGLYANGIVGILLKDSTRLKFSINKRDFGDYKS